MKLAGLAPVRPLLRRQPWCLQPGVEGENVLLEHRLKEPDRVIAVPQDQPRSAPAKTLQANFSWNWSKPRYPGKPS